MAEPSELRPVRISLFFKFDDGVWRGDALRTPRPGTLFYLDPPYHGCENLYGKGLFKRSDFHRLACEFVGTMKLMTV